MQKLLIISYAFPPVNLPSAQRPYYFAKILGESGIKITVLSAKNPDSVYGTGLFLESLNNVTVIRSFNFNLSFFRSAKNISVNLTTKDKRFSFVYLKRKTFKIVEKVIFPDKGLFWLPSAIITGIKILLKEKNSPVFSTSPLFSNHLIALFLKKTFNNLWIADFRDFHYAYHIENEKKGLRTILHKVAEHKTIKCADQVVFISNSMKNLYSNKYPDYKKKFVTITNGFDINLYLKKRQHSTINKKINIVYAGSFYNGERSPFPLLNALEEMVLSNLIEKNEFTIDLYGIVDNKIRNIIKSFYISRSININGILSRDEVFKKFETADIFWLIVGNNIYHRAGIPLKFFDYLIYKKFIWAFLPENSELEVVLNELNFGEVFVPSNKNKTILKLLKYFELFRNDRSARPDYVPLYKLEKYTRQFQAQQLLSLLNKNT